jgi:nucleoside-diphosphate-sugar epimerase
MKFLVTGGLGFIGHNVVRILEGFHHECVIIDNKTNYGIISQKEIDYLFIERMLRVKTRNIILNSIEEQLEDSLFKEVDVVIHLASFPRQKLVSMNPQWGSRVIIEGLLNLLELSVRNKIKKIVYISSSMVYGNFDKNESFNGIDETFNCSPIGQYGIMKLAGEWLVKDYASRHNINYTIIRPSAVYGPYDVEDRVVSKFFLSAMRGQEIKVNGYNEKLDFTYVDDASTGIALAAVSEHSNNSIYNISHGEARTLLEAAEIVVKLVGKGTIKVNPRDNNFPQRSQLNIFRAKNDFGYCPEINIEEGFQKYYEWLKNSIYRT